MKKKLCIFLVLAAFLGCLTGCSLIGNKTDSGTDAARLTAKVEEMMDALAENRTADAAAMMHPGNPNAEYVVDQVCKYLDGRHIDAIEVETFNVNITSDNVWEALATYQIVLTDGVKFRLFVNYYFNNALEGFTSFALLDEIKGTSRDRAVLLSLSETFKLTRGQ